MICWIDGRLTPSAEATVHVSSNAVFRGTTVFDVMSIVTVDERRAVVGLCAHLDRFLHSMTSMHMTPAVGIAELEQATADVVRANPGCGIVRCAALWTGAAAGVPVDRTPSIVITAEPAPPPAADPVSLQSVIAKIDGAVLPPDLKVAAIYTAGVRAQIVAREAGYDNVVNRTIDGDLAEGVSSSVAVVAEGRLLLPPLDRVLDSVTRRLVVAVAEHERIDVEVRRVRWSEVLAADEVFMSSTTAPVVPVRQVDERHYGPERPVTTRIGAAVAEVLGGGHPLSPHWLTGLS